MFGAILLAFGTIPLIWGIMSAVVQTAMVHGYMSSGKAEGNVKLNLNAQSIMIMVGAVMMAISTGV